MTTKGASDCAEQLLSISPPKFFVVIFFLLQFVWSLFAVCCREVDTDRLGASDDEG